ncbi:hypothetical protein GDO81_007462 [Engystomops pustulosus]|uniref:Uncharacterized protein n=1 Tax=Engystomops pustulosus TaxID=76066 RepID=A0AAV7C8A5_ENGPU|nr:hypothetical protein GDO81_007462 [Engystomops pustulosus]
MDGTPMSEEYRGIYVSSDWKDPRGRDINFDINIDGSFKWPFCEAVDEGCWTFTQWVYLAKNKPVRNLVLQAGDGDQWYQFKGRGKICVTVSSWSGKGVPEDKGPFSSSADKEDSANSGDGHGTSKYGSFHTVEVS